MFDSNTTKADQMNPVRDKSSCCDDRSSVNSIDTPGNNKDKLDSSNKATNISNGVNNLILSVRDIHFAYQQKDEGFAISVDKLDIYPCERLALIGPNGAGKTTLLQLIALLQQANLGTISFNDVELKTDAQILNYHRATAFVPQRAVLYNCSVYDNVALGLKIRNLTASEMNDKTEDMLATFKIQNLAGRSALKISGGEARRVMLARALALNPKILFLDEPFGDLDEPVRLELIDDLLPVLSRTGCATVFVTHNQDETYQLADRFMIMLKGRIVQSGTGQEIFGNPVNQEIAQFIGIKNVLPARVINTEKDIIQVSLISSNKSGPQLYVSGNKPKTENVIVCIPPESIIVADSSQNMHASSRNNIPGLVRKIIPSRYFSWVEIDCGVMLTASITNESIRELGLVPGKAVQVLIKSTAIRLLEK
jgi:tungstate transport system ATP-binding protein